MVLVGYGAVGRQVAAAMCAAAIPYIVVEQNRARVEPLRAQGIPAVSGDARDAVVLVQAHIAEAGMLVVAVAESTDIRPMIETARTLNPEIPVIARAPNAEEAQLLADSGATRVVHPKQALADAIVRELSAQLQTRMVAG